MIKVTLFLFTIGILWSCANDQPDHTVVDFDYQIEGDCATPVLEVILENKTLSADSYLWDFGDGTSSDEVNPKKVFAKSGDYTIKLTAYFSDQVVQIEKQIHIVRNSDGTGPLAQLDFERRDATKLELTFEVTTEEPSYSLFFGDGLTISSEEKIVTHHYSGPGIYSVLLIVKNEEGCNCADAMINLSP